MKELKFESNQIQVLNRWRFQCNNNSFRSILLKLRKVNGGGGGEVYTKFGIIFLPLKQPATRVDPDLFFFLLFLFSFASSLACSRLVVSLKMLTSPEIQEKVFSAKLPIFSPQKTFFLKEIIFLTFFRYCFNFRFAKGLGVITLHSKNFNNKTGGGVITSYCLFNFYKSTFLNTVLYKQNKSTHIPYK